jgi:hypothetical protein
MTREKIGEFGEGVLCTEWASFTVIVDLASYFIKESPRLVDRPHRLCRLDRLNIANHKLSIEAYSHLSELQ